MYCLSYIALVGWVFYSFSKKYSQQKEIVQQSEIIIDQLKNEKLETEITHKNRELISTSLHLAHKNEVFKKVKNDILKLAKKCTDLSTKQNLEAIIKVLSNEEGYLLPQNIQWYPLLLGKLKDSSRKNLLLPLLIQNDNKRLPICCVLQP